ncbi:hypothetical protein [Halovivax cerinus]|uniref:Uncharacterized protein n=1 Tax=Halovivax cerinus TaxID=1487865 RepID=A0ABD5NM40_9EURY|nr:hypothetical protein [Halovivax cerinus]
MNIKRIVIFGVLGVVFSGALLSANVLVATDRTVMNSEYATDTAAEAELYASLETEIEGQLGGDGGTISPALPIDRSTNDVLAAAITREYVRSQVDANVDELYAYLHGERETLSLTIETDPVIENAVTELEAELQGVSPSDFDETLSGLATGTGETAPGTAIEEMAESQSSFDEHRASFEARIKQQIQDETPRHLSDEELDRRYERRRGDIRADLLDEQERQIQAAVDDGTIPASVADPVETIVDARVEALTGAIGYDTYSETVETGMAELRSAALTEAEDTIRAEAPESVNVTEEFGAQERSTMETAQTATTTASTLAIVLPLLALGLAALLTWIGPPSSAARLVGSATAMVGLASLVGAQFASGAVESAIESANGPEAAMRFVQLLVDGLVGLLTWQSIGLLVVGVGLVGASVAIRRDLILPAYE